MPKPDFITMPNADLIDSASSSPHGGTMNFRKFIELIYDKIWLLVSCVVVAVFLAIIYLLIAARVYEATATIQVEQEDPLFNKTSMTSSTEMDEEIFNTVAQKLSNLSLLEKVLEENKLLAPGSSTNNLADALLRDNIIAKFSKNTKISLRRNTRLIDVSVRDTDPRLAAKLANSLLHDYLEQEALMRETANEGDSAILRQEADRFKQKLEASDQALQDYRKQIGSVSLDQSQNIITPQLQEISTRLTQSKADLILAKGAYQDSLKMPTNVDDLMAYPQIITNTDVAQISADVERLNSDFAIVRQRYREKHPKYILAESSLNAIKNQLAITAIKVRSRIQETMRITYENALTAEQGLEMQLHDTENKALQLSDYSVHFDVLAREVQSDKALYDAVIMRLGETVGSTQITSESIRIVQPPTVPHKPISPKVRVVLMMAILGGLGLGAGLIFLFKAGDTSFHGADEVEQTLGLPVLGLVPKLSNFNNDDSHDALMDLKSINVEGLHTLRANLLLLELENEKKTYLFTSSVPGEGKTFISVNFAASHARQGKRTLLIDLDLRCPMIEKVFRGNTTNAPGVTDYFLGTKSFNELYQPHPDIPKLFWMSSGKLAPNPTEILMQIKFQQLLNEAMLQFDCIVIDTAPILPVSDTLLLATKVQTIILVVEACKTPRMSVERSVQSLKNVKAPISGVLLNLLPTRRLIDYYYGDDNGYGTYGKKKEAFKPADWLRQRFLPKKNSKKEKSVDI
jgi:polysaccharide biosynthesis transport protein